MNDKTEQARLRHKAIIAAEKDKLKGLIKVVTDDYLQALMNTIKAYEQAA